MKSDIKMLFFDLEVSPNLMYGYGTFKVHPLKIEQYADIMSISWAWGDSEEIQHASPLTLARKRGTSTSKAMAQHIKSLFDEADIVVAHNAYKFDIRVANAQMIRHGLTPPKPYKVVDTLRVARQVGMFPGGNSLNALGDFLEVGVKSETGIRDLWYKCLKGDKKSWDLLREYNDQDVRLLQAVYKKLLPYTRNHPNMGDISQIDGICPRCASPDLKKEGTHARRGGRVQSYSCNSCGGWCSEATIKKIGRKVSFS